MIGNHSSDPSSLTLRKEPRVRCTNACLNTRGLFMPPNTIPLYHTRTRDTRTPTMRKMTFHRKRMRPRQSPWTSS